MARYFSLLLVLLSIWALPARAELPTPVSQALQKQGVPAENVAVFVQQVDASQPLVSHLADQAFSPASVMKLLTTYAALDLLGPAYRWRTEIYQDGELLNGVLKGNLIIKGYGDPYFRAEDFWQLLTYVRQTGIRDIHGDLVLDGTYFDPVADNPGAFDGEPFRAYNALPHALLLNFKTTSFRLAPDPVNKRVHIFPHPDVPEIRIDNKLALSQGSCGDWRERLRYEVQPMPSSPGGEQVAMLLSFNGSYAESCGEKALELSLLDDDTYTLSLFRKIWQQLGGTLTGGLQTGVLPPSAKLVAEYRSPPLSDIVRGINKYSNNLMTRQLLLTIAAQQVGIPATASGGDAAIREWLASKNAEFPELVLENGSGLSRIARISAAHLGWLLLDAYQSPVMPELMSALPILSVDGTLKQRLKESPAKGRTHIKTGSLDDVRAMAGYLLDREGHRWVIVFLANHPSAWTTVEAQDALIEWVYNHEAHCCGHQVRHPH